MATKLTPRPQPPIPTVRKLIWATIVGLKSHPRLQNPGIFDPIVEEGEEPEEIFIERWRSYDGQEYQEPGLTCAVYPDHSAINLNTNRSVNIEPYELARGQNKMTYRLAIKLLNRGVALNNTKKVNYFLLQTPDGLYTPHGFNFYFNDDIKISKGTAALKEFNSRFEYQYPDDKVKQIKKLDMEIEINPAEEILREYADLIRLCLEDMYRIMPWKIAGSRVTGYDFPTTTWSDDEPDIFFHQAIINWEVTLFAPSSHNIKMMNSIPTNTLDLSPEV